MSRTGLNLALLALLALATAAAADARVAPRPADEALASRLVVGAADTGAAFTSLGRASGRLSPCTPLDRSALVTGRAHGPILVSDDAQVASAATVYATARQAAAASVRARHGTASRCAVRELARALRVVGSDFRVVGRHVRTLREPARLARIAFTVASRGRRLRGAYDAIVLKRGRALAVFTVLRLGRPPSGALERRIAARVLGRVDNGPRPH